MTDYKKYLKTALVGDSKIITYRQLARELKVHINVAKEMLYDFHHDLNLRKPASCHATYILSGLRKTSDSSSLPPESEGTKDAEGDEVMSCSPIEPPQTSPVGEGGKNGDAVAGGMKKGLVRSIVLVGEERLEEIKASFELLSAIHVYSIEPTPLSDMLLLADNSLDVMRLDATEAIPQDIAKKYGSIMNLHAKRRMGPHGVPPPVAAPAAAIVKKATATATPSAPAEEKKSIFGKKTASATPSISTSTPAASTTATQGKRAQADFFKVFGGAGAKKKENKKADDPPAPSASSAKPKAEKTSPPTKDTITPTPQLKKGNLVNIDKLEESEESEEEEKLRPSEDEDEPMPEVQSSQEESEEEEDPDLTPPSKKRTTTSATNEEHAKRRAERSAKLRAMMDDSDEEIPPSAQPNNTALNEILDDDEIPPSAQKLPSPVAVTSSAPRRRRARRKVPKRITTRDKDGYLVTKNEMVWESYSEDEPEAPPPLARANKKENPAREKKEEVGAEQGKKKVPAKKGTQQGNIMSFFGKK